jgi:hypothetical protein
MGSGKSPVASMIEYRLGVECIRLDRYLPQPPPLSSTKYVDAIDLHRLSIDLSSALTAGVAVIEGVLIRNILDRLQIVAANQTFHVYVAGAWKPDNARVTWPDERQLGSDKVGSLSAEIVEYHRTKSPHQLFDALILRDQDEPEKTGAFLAPDGQSFEVSETAWPRENIHQLRANRNSFVCNQADAAYESLGLIRPPTLGPSTRSLENDRLRSVLQAIVSGTSLPAVVVIRDRGEAIATLLDGAHRYFGSVATGAVQIPVHHVAREMAELCYRHNK